MRNYKDMPDGEYFVDTAVKSIPHADTWTSMSANQLLDIQTQLETRAWEFAKNPAMKVQIDAALQRLQGIMASKDAHN